MGECDEKRFLHADELLARSLQAKELTISCTTVLQGTQMGFRNAIKTTSF